MTIALEGVEKLKKDLREAAAELSDREARYLVDAYYTIQSHRIEAQNQVRALTDSDEPNATIGWLFDQHETLEKEIKKALQTYADSHIAGIWAQSILGIGPVIASGLLAHIDVEKAPTVGHIYSFAGLNPEQKWEKGQKRPWNAKLKVLCWKIGESFVKVSGRDCEFEGGSFTSTPRHVCSNYGHVYVERKLYETEKNENGDYADQAAETLEKKNYNKDTDAYKAYIKGRLPIARIHERSKRYATKLFLAHYHHVLFEARFGEPPPKPYIIEHGGHVHYIAPPKWPF